MGRTSRREPFLRRVHFETFEERIAMTAQPVADFYLDEALRAPLEHHANLAPQLGDVHSWTGLSYVRQQYGLRGTGQTVAVIDSGIAYDHWALGSGYGSGYRVVGGWDFAENDANPYDDGPAGFHGTHVAGIIGSSNTTYVGVAPEVDLVALRVFNDQGSGYFSWVERALSWVYTNRNAFTNPITTVNLSLGTSWNSDDPPNWAMLEEEFQQLRDAGIFISVSAGNSFDSYNTPGLSYPAASSYVVPVASVDNNGNLSYFSQRNHRVLAAPGEYITSTVPDYTFGADGIPNDFGTASGTSMAAPYVAGASVLVREAMQLLGYTAITQASIYEHLRNTATLVYDAATDASYHRIDLQRALDSLVPADEYGSTSAAAHNLGQLGTSSITVNGYINRLTDRDYFRFTAAETGEVTWTITAGGAVNPSWELVGGSGRVEGNKFIFNVQAGQSYTVGLATSRGIGSYSIGVNLAPTIIDLGTVQYTYLAGQTAASGEIWYRFTAARQGTLTVAGSSVGSNAAPVFELYNAEGQHLTTSGTTGNDARLDTTVSAGQTYRLRVAATAPVNLRLANLIVAEGTTVNVFGSSAADTFTLVAGSTHQLTVNGLTYGFQRNAVTRIHVAGASGLDQVTLVGTDQNETALLRPGEFRLEGSNFTYTGQEVEHVRLFTGQGHDVVRLFDSAGDDCLVATQDYVRLDGPSLSFYVQGAEEAYVYALAGGLDCAYLYDTPGDDRFTATPDYGVVWNSRFYHYAQGFERLHAYARLGGTDYVHMYDSAGNDRFVATPQYALFTGDSLYSYAEGFAYVHAYSRAGSDYAYIYDSPGDERFVSTPAYARMDSDRMHVYTQAFARVHAYSRSGGIDSAHLYDSAGDDRYTATAEYSLIQSTGYFSYVQGFRRVHAIARSGGEDLAFLYDSSGDDRYIATPEYALLEGSNLYQYVQGFDQVRAHAVRGGIDFAYLYDSAGDDTFTATPTQAELRGAAFLNSAHQFERVHAYARSGGVDRAYLYDSPGNDFLDATPEYALFRGSSFSNYAQGFRELYAYATQGGYDTVRLIDSLGDDVLDLARDQVRLRGSTFSNSAQGFDLVHALGGRGGTDLVEVLDAGTEDTIYGRNAYAQLRRSGSAAVIERYGRVRVRHAAEASPQVDVALVDYVFELLGGSA